jgi:hypothetical protein
MNQRVVICSRMAISKLVLVLSSKAEISHA